MHLPPSFVSLQPYINAFSLSYESCASSILDLFILLPPRLPFWVSQTTPRDV